MLSRCLTAFALLALLGVVPAEAQNTSSSAQLRRFSLTVGAGSNIKDGGDGQAVSFGYSPTRGVTLLGNVERNHVPTRRTQYTDGYSLTRGGTVTFVSGEVRYAPLEGRRVSPFVLGGAGIGQSRPNVNDMFPDEVTNTARVIYGGGGVLFNLSPSVAVGVEAKLLLLAERDDVGAMAPIRGVVTWRF
jgi:hypothetical protein